MSREGFLTEFWSDVEYDSKIMSNFNGPVKVQVLRRVSGQADKEERSAPAVGVEYNNFMGGDRPGRFHSWSDSTVHTIAAKMVALHILLVVRHNDVHTTHLFCTDGVSLAHTVTRSVR